MKLILDTCAFLWVLSDPLKLFEKARNFFSDPANTPIEQRKIERGLKEAGIRLKGAYVEDMGVGSK
ncbi:MAG: hypothetical protein HZA01_11325 [Nitrospinae bacterium]|nr:hypothetical protein [Nitrospinota bacterium]